MISGPFAQASLRRHIVEQLRKPINNYNGRFSTLNCYINCNYRSLLLATGAPQLCRAAASETLSLATHFAPLFSLHFRQRRTAFRVATNCRQRYTAAANTGFNQLEPAAGRGGTATLTRLTCYVTTRETTSAVDLCWARTREWLCEVATCFSVLNPSTDRSLQVRYLLNARGAISGRTERYFDAILFHCCQLWPS